MTTHRKATKRWQPPYSVPEETNLYVRDISVTKIMQYPEILFMRYNKLCMPVHHLFTFLSTFALAFASSVHQYEQYKDT